jgi:hypothetical protein
MTTFIKTRYKECEEGMFAFFIIFLGGREMSWQVIEYMDNNPQATPKDVIGYFAEILEVDNQTKFLTSEINKVLEIREALRPLYGKKMNLDSNLALLDSDFEMDVMAKYPPRQGTDKDRKAYKLKLQLENADYQKGKSELDQCKEEITLLEEKMADVQQNAKNARRILETFNHTMAFVIETSKSAAPNTLGIDTSIVNADVF